MPTTITAQDFYAAMPGYLDCPEVMVNLHIESVDSKDDCLDSSYASGVIKLLKFYYIAMMCSAASGGQKQITSRRAPSGAAQGFSFYDPSSELTLKKAIEALDRKRCLSDMLVGSVFSIGSSGRRCKSGGC